MSFDDLVGQDHVSRTLGSAIEKGRVAHAFLFTGVRGVGKTTSARILAKALNCMGDPDRPKGEDPGPTVNPCLKCPACKEIAEGTDMDVREIDGASYNGVDEVRKLQDSLPYRPTRDRFKIIIVDEVHMLSGAAWNAFLKTLEEPPPHVKFIFATTEAHKVPITILSRVQRFDFKLIPARVIADRLRYVLSEEGVAADESAILLLARQAAGSMRDGMSLLDQVIAFGGEELHGEDVAQVLGVASRTALLGLAQALVSGVPEECVKLVGQIADQGFDITHVARDLLGLLRDLVVARICENPADLVDLADEERSRVLDLAASASESDLLRLHQGFSRGFDDITRGADPRANLEMLLVRLALRPALLPVDELLYRLGALEKRLSGGATRSRGRSRPTAPPQAPAAVPQRSESRPRTTVSPSAQGSRDGGASPPGPAEDRSGPEDPDGPGPDATGDPHGGTLENTDDGTPPPSDAEVVRGLAREPAEPPPGGPEPKEAARAKPRATKPSPGALTDLKPSTAKLSNGAPEDVKLDEPKLDDPQLDDAEIARIKGMMQVCDELREEHMELVAYLEQTTPLICDGQSLTVALESGFLFEAHLTSKENRKLLQNALSVIWQTDASLDIQRDSPLAAPHLTVAAARKQQRLRQRRAMIEEVKNHPRVKRAVELLDARVREVHLPDELR